MANKHASIRKPGSRGEHYALDRPHGTFVDELPQSVIAASTQSMWQVIVRRLIHNPNRWFQLARTYSQPSAPLKSARKVLAEDYSSDLAERLQYAYAPVDEDDPASRVVVYLRIDMESKHDAPTTTASEESSEEEASDGEG